MEPVPVEDKSSDSVDSKKDPINKRIDGRQPYHQILQIANEAECLSNATQEQKAGGRSGERVTSIFGIHCGAGNTARYV